MRGVNHLARTRIFAGVPVAALAAAMFGVGATGATRATVAGRAAAASQVNGAAHRRDITTGEQIYRTTCAACHGADGKGAPRTTVGFAETLPDLTDCKLTSSEMDADLVAIIRDGAPVRGLTRIMPAFRDLLTAAEIRSVIDYIHSLCHESGWPRGDFNLPLPQVTEKAFPEDEMVLTSAASTGGPGSVTNHVIFEKRFGSHDQLELDVPFGFVARPGHSSWAGGLGDISIAPKHVFWSSLSSGTILSGLAGVILPTGDQPTGLGSGTTAFEGYLLGAQLLPRRSFFQFQGGVELPVDRTRAQPAASWSGALGKTVAFGPITRIWSPMVELTGTRDFIKGAPVDWDVVPQFQLSLSALQHVRMGVGVDIPLTDTRTRYSQIRAYLLWDMYDGTLLQGWKGWCPGCQH